MPQSKFFIFNILCLLAAPLAFAQDSLSTEEINRRLQGASVFTPRYIENHGNIINTEVEEFPEIQTTQTINIYASGQVEVIQVLDIYEWEQGLDYNADGDLLDRVKRRRVLIDQSLYKEHIQILSESGTVLRDFGERVTTATRRIQMPQGIPNFLRFSGATDAVRVHISTAETSGQYYVKIEKLDPSIKLIVWKRTYDPENSDPRERIKGEELSPDYFEEAPLIRTSNNTITYAIYATRDLYQKPFREHPNFHIRYDSINSANPILMKANLDKVLDILKRANLSSFLSNFKKTRIVYNPYQAGSRYEGTIILGGGHRYASRPLIHEAAHSYHDNQISNGDYTKIEALYDSLPSKDTDVPYGDEKNSYWRINANEFFAETLTTYIYIKANENPDWAIRQVDSTFYNNVMVPYFEKLFGVCAGSCPDSTPDFAQAIELNPQGYAGGSISRRIEAGLQSRTDIDIFQIEVPFGGILTAATIGDPDTISRLYREQAEGEPLLVATGTDRGYLGYAVKPGIYYVEVAARQTFGDYNLQVHYSPAALGVPGAGSPQSGVGVLSGWACDIATVEFVVESEGKAPRTFEAGYGTSRADTASVCGADTTDTGFGLLFNWNLLGNGQHTVKVVLDGVEFAKREVTVTTLGREFRTDLEATTEVANFPRAGESITLEWEQGLQNFVIAGEERARGGAQLVPLEARLGVPAAGSFQSGIGIISGWACEADTVEIVFESHETGDSSTFEASYGTERRDTADICGDTDNGFGLLFNWNLLGPGVHTVRAFADGVEFAYSVVTVAMPSRESFLRGVRGSHEVKDFPKPGQTTTLEWQQGRQNFIITGVEPEE